MLLRPVDRPIVPPCRGLCRGERPAWDSPAALGPRGDGTRVLYCQCCLTVLRRVDVGIADAPNISKDIDQSRRLRFNCDACDFEVVVLPELVAK